MSDSQTTELSQGSIVKKSKQLGLKAMQLKLPTITDFAAEHSRERDWDNIVTTHVGESAARTWFWQNKNLGKHKLQHPSVTGDAKATDISACGNFVVIGYTTGEVLKYNLQSGKYRGAFGAPKVRFFFRQKSTLEECHWFPHLCSA
jgi:U3 small nucleolar RNA-associated protein 21